MKCDNPECNNERRDESKYCSVYCARRTRDLRYVAKHGKEVYRREKPQVKQVRYTEKKLTQAQIDANIERIAQRAAANGTSGWAQLAPGD
jgi:hypothetical protein